MRGDNLAMGRSLSHRGNASFDSGGNAVENAPVNAAGRRASEELTPAIQEPDLAGAHYRLGLIAEKSDRPDIARSEYGISVEMDPTFEPVATALAKVPQ